MNPMRFNNSRPYIALALLWLAAAVAACTGPRMQSGQERKNGPVITSDMIVVTAAKQDTFSSLALTYLKDADKGWWISTFNDMQTLRPGERVLIPTKPFRLGGLYPNSYQTVPVLLYRTIKVKPSDKNGVSAAAFNLQLEYLRSQGFVSVSLDQFSAFLDLRDQLPPKSIMICFDSSDADFLDTALPLLKKYDMTASLFVATQRVGQPGRFTWDQLARLKAEGFSIGTIGTTGNNLYTVKPGEDPDAYLKRVDEEIRDAASLLRLKLKLTAVDFAYPNGVPNDLLIAFLKKYGYRTAFTRQQGINPFFVNNYTIRRSAVNGQWDMDRFKAEIPVSREAVLR